MKVELMKASELLLEVVAYIHELEERVSVLEKETQCLEDEYETLKTRHDDASRLRQHHEKQIGQMLSRLDVIKCLRSYLKEHDLIDFQWNKSTHRAEVSWGEHTLMYMKEWMEAKYP